MPQVSESIPRSLQPRVDAALDWFNASSEAADEVFRVTGILDASEALSGSDELQLLLCGGDRCEQLTFRVTRNGDLHTVALIDRERSVQQSDRPQGDLDPPPGVRRGWVDGVLSQHAFVVLLFYRGFW